jgi:ribosomal protein S14
MEKLRDGRLLGRFFTTSRAKLREIAERLGMRRPVSVVGYPV